jgi:hypothetical protein
MAGHLVATGAGTVSLSTQYWHAPVVEGAAYTLRAYVYHDDPNMQTVLIGLAFLSEGVIELLKLDGTHLKFPRPAY